MPNGQCYVPFRKPGKYSCCVCGDLKDADEFYKDSSRYNGCSSRCKICERHRDRSDRIRSDSKVSLSPEQRTSVDNSWSDRQIKKRVDEIKSDLREEVKSEYKVAKRDEDGVPVLIEKKIHYNDGSWEIRFEKGTVGSG